MRREQICACGLQGPVAPGKGMGQIHGQIFGKDVVKACLRHALYVRKRRAQLKRRGEVAIAPAQVDRAKLAGKVVDLREKLLVDGGKCCEASGRQGVQKAAFPHEKRLPPADVRRCPRGFRRACQARFPGPDHYRI